MDANRGRGIALHQLGSVHLRNQRWDDAIAAFQQALSLHSNFPEAFNDLGNALEATGRLQEAIQCYRRALAIKPDFPHAHYNFGNVLKNQGRFDEAADCYRRALAIAPDLLAGYVNLGIVLKNTGRLDQAIASYQQALTLNPHLPETYSNLANALKAKGLHDQAITAYRKALELNPDDAITHSNLLLAFQYQPDLDAKTIYEEHRRWDQKHARPLAPSIQPWSNSREPDRRLRIGYVSPDFRRHPVSYFFEPLLSRHDHQPFEIFCYADEFISDETTGRLTTLADHWRPITRMSDDAVASVIRQDQIDILVDLAGHSGNNRMLLFARKPAPVQVSYLGYPDTTGLTAMDYRITDSFADPPGTTEPLHSETLVRLPATAWCYAPPTLSPDVSPSPFLSACHVTFGCFNALAKINSRVIALWSQILRQFPNARLVLKDKAFAEASVANSLRSALAIPPDRCDLLAYAPDYMDHLKLYSRLDIALDPFPYNGTTTTCEALWMGVPVITLAGQRHAARVGVSLLSNTGLTDLIAHSDQEYIQIAVHLARNKDRLVQLRADLRRAMQASPLMNANAFASDIQTAYRRMWQDWCRMGLGAV